MGGSGKSFSGQRFPIRCTKEQRNGLAHRVGLRPNDSRLCCPLCCDSKKPPDQLSALFLPRSIACKLSRGSA